MPPSRRALPFPPRVLAVGLVPLGAGAYWALLKVLAVCVRACSGASSFAMEGTSQPVLAPRHHAEFIGLFVVVFAPLLYGIVRVTSTPRGGTRTGGTRTETDTTVPRAICAAGFTFLCAAPLEIFVDSAFFAITGRPCWEYRVWPIHHGYTSGVGAVMWPMYGAFVYGFHGAIRSRPDLRWLHGLAARAALVAVEAMVLEIAANAFALIQYHHFYFYYLPDDLDHLTTMQILVPYFGAGLLGLTLLDRVERLPWPALVGVVCWALGAGVVFGVVR